MGEIWHTVRISGHLVRSCKEFLASDRADRLGLLTLKDVVEYFTRKGIDDKVWEYAVFHYVYYPWIMRLVMCQVKDCKNKANGEILTTFGNNEITIRLCKLHQADYIINEDVSHSHQWVSYASLAGCSCLAYVCSMSMGNNLL